jgi:hypothetical protein
MADNVGAKDRPTNDLLDELAAELSALGTEPRADGSPSSGLKTIADEFFEAFPNEKPAKNALNSDAQSNSHLVDLLGDDLAAPNCIFFLT